MLKFAFRCTLAAFFLCSMWASDSFARSGSPSEQQRCSGDVSRFCRKFIADGDFAVLGCLKKHRRMISSGCRKVLRDNGQ